MTEVCNCGGGHRTRLKDQLVCSRVPPLPLYIKDGGGEAGQPLGRAHVWSPTRTPSPSRIPPRGREGEGRRGRGEGKGGKPPFRCPNIAFQYIDLYVSIISRLLIMPVISSGTPNKFQSSNHITLLIQIVI